MRCDASIDTEQPLYWSYILVLISTYQVSSVWLECRTLHRKEECKRLLYRRGIEPRITRTCVKCFDHWATDIQLHRLPTWALWLNYKHPYMRCDASIDTEQPLYWSYILVLISTYKVSSVWLECRVLQRKGECKRLMCQRGIEPQTSQFHTNCSDHWATDTHLLRFPTWALWLNYRHPYMRCDASIDTEQPLYRFKMRYTE